LAANRKNAPAYSQRPGQTAGLLSTDAPLFLEECGWYRAEKAVHLLIGGIASAVENQNRDLDGAERLWRP
jgi:hypothetical protein